MSFSAFAIPRPHFNKAPILASIFKNLKLLGKRSVPSQGVGIFLVPFFSSPLFQFVPGNPPICTLKVNSPVLGCLCLPPPAPKGPLFWSAFGAGWTEGRRPWGRNPEPHEARGVRAAGISLLYLTLPPANWLPAPAPAP